MTFRTAATAVSHSASHRARVPIWGRRSVTTCRGSANLLSAPGLSADLIGPSFSPLYRQRSERGQGTRRADASGIEFAALGIAPQVRLP